MNNRKKTTPGLENLREKWVYGLQKPEMLPMHKTCKFQP